MDIFSRARKGWPILGFAIVFTVFLWPIFRGEGLVAADGIFRLAPWRSLGLRPASNPLLSDQYLTFPPARHFFYERFRAGDVPLWNPQIACGVPSVGSMQIAVYYPVNLLLAFVHPFYAAGLAALIKLWLAAGFTFLLVRQLGGSSAGAFLAGLSFSLSGFMTVWLGHPHTNCGSLLPAILYFIEKALASRDRRHWIALGLAYGAMALGGHPPSILMIGVITTAYFLYRARPILGHARGFALAAALGAGLAAIQIVPYLEYYSLSSTGEASAAMKRWAYRLSPRTALHFLIPLAGGSPARRFESLGVAFGLEGGPYDNFNERTGYAGLGAFFLAGVALAARREAPARFLAAGAAVCLAWIWGLLPSVLLKGIPIAGSINPTRLLLFCDFAVAVLAGLALDRLSGLKRGRWLAGLLVAGAAALAWLAWAFAPYWNQLTDAERRFLGAQAAVFSAALAAVALAVRFGARRWAPALLTAAVAGELLYYGAGTNPSLRREDYFPTTPAIERLRSETPPYRVFGLGWGLAPNTAGIYGLSDARGQDYTTIRRYEELITGRAGDYFFYTTPTEFPAALPLLGVKHLLCERDCRPPEGWSLDYDGEVKLYRAAAPLRAFRASRWEVASPGAILERIRSGGFDPRGLVYLEEAPSVASAPGLAAPAEIVSESPDEVVVRARAGAPGLLVLLDSYFPGWKAWVNGRPAKILRADYHFRAVEIPEGEAVVRFSYEPWSFRLGAALSVAALLAAALAWRRRWA